MPSALLHFSDEISFLVSFDRSYDATFGGKSIINWLKRIFEEFHNILLTLQYVGVFDESK